MLARYLRPRDRTKGGGWSSASAETAQTYRFSWNFFHLNRYNQSIPYRKGWQAIPRHTIQAGCSTVQGTRQCVIEGRGRGVALGSTSHDVTTTKVRPGRAARAPASVHAIKGGSDNEEL